MEPILENVNWVVVIVSAVLSFFLGYLWYSDSLFGKGWRQGIGATELKRPLGPMLVAQFLGGLFLSWVLVVALAHSWALAILVAITISGTVKLNGLFSGKSMYALLTEAGYVIAQAVLVMVVYSIFN